MGFLWSHPIFESNLFTTSFFSFTFLASAKNNHILTKQAILLKLEDTNLLVVSAEGNIIVDGKVYVC